MEAQRLVEVFMSEPVTIKTELIGSGFQYCRSVGRHSGSKGEV
jgi:hypothetical protein